jgi:hypothetical protein
MTSNMNAIKQKPRWYRYSLWAILIFVFLPTDAIMWYPYVEFQKGHAVLYVLTIVCIATLFISLRLVLALFHQKLFQFSIRSLLLFTAVVAVAFSWLGTEMRWAGKQKEAIAALHNKNGNKTMVASLWDCDGTVTYTHAYYQTNNWGWWNERQPAAPDWLENVLGTEFFNTVDIVTLEGPEITDAELEKVKDIRHLRLLRLSKTNVTDDGIDRLQKAMPNLYIRRDWER